MSRNRKSQKPQDLKLNLPVLLPARGDTSRRMVVADEASPHGHMSSTSPSSSSSPSSCLSSEAELGMRSPISPGAMSSMVLAGCPRCLMYVMLSEDDLKCPKCSSTVLLDFCNTTTTTKNNKHGNKKSRMS